MNDVDKHHSPSIGNVEESREQWIGVDLYDTAERGALDKCLSRFVSISAQISATR